MDITGKIKEVHEPVTGEGRNGKWSKQNFVIETGTDYPKQVCIMVWGDKIDLSKFSPGDQVKVGFDLESREFNGRWYTDVKAWKVEKIGGSQSTDMPSADDIPFDELPDDGGGLPF